MNETHTWSTSNFIWISWLMRVTSLVSLLIEDSFSQPVWSLFQLVYLWCISNNENDTGFEICPFPLHWTKTCIIWNCIISVNILRDILMFCASSISCHLCVFSISFSSQRLRQSRTLMCVLKPISSYVMYRKHSYHDEIPKHYDYIMLEF